MNYIDGQLFKKMIISGANELTNNKELLNALNVFPVPDGDTGTNMSLTVSAGAKSVNAVEEVTVAKIVKALSSGALRGARGNSGVITSQLFRGLSIQLKENETINVRSFALALDAAREMAYKAVMKPREGTILTLARMVAEKAIEIQFDYEDVIEFLEVICAYAEEVVLMTTDMLEVLKQANVVDSGAKGFCFILQGMLKALKGNAVELLSADEIQKVEINTNVTPNEECEFGYCTEFFIAMDVATQQMENELRLALSEFGNSIVVVADTDTIKVHVHSETPWKAIKLAQKYGELDDIKIDNMTLEAEERKKRNAELNKEMPKKEIAVIAVSSGEGFVEILMGLGCDYVIEGGQSMNPSTEDILNAIDKVNADNIIILPNNSNIILASEQAAQIEENKNIFVIPSKTIPQGVQALINFIPNGSIEEVVETMKLSMNDIKSGQVTYAVRDTEFDGIAITEGDYLFIDDETIKHTSKDIVQGTIDLVKEMADNDTDAIVTLYKGQDVSQDDVDKVTEELEELGYEIDIYDGGQPIYYFIVSVEE